MINIIYISFITNKRDWSEVFDGTPPWAQANLQIDSPGEFITRKINILVFSNLVKLNNLSILNSNLLVHNMVSDENDMNHTHPLVPLHATINQHLVINGKNNTYVIAS